MIGTTDGVATNVGITTVAPVQAVPDGGYIGGTPAVAPDAGSPK
jgi:hypothetical protein